MTERAVARTVPEITPVVRSSVKHALTPPSTGLGALDQVLSTPASFAAGTTDAVHDLGSGVVGLAVDFVDIPGDWHAWHRGDVMPIQRPGLGLLNLGAHPVDAAKAMVGWQYRNDPARMGAYGAVNVLAMISTGGGGSSRRAAWRPGWPRSPSGVPSC